MSKKKLFENNLYGHSVWWNENPYIIWVAIFDKDGIFIKSLQISSRDYIIVPPGATVELISRDYNVGESNQKRIKT